MTEAETPMGTMVLRTACFPRDTNYAGDIFGGFLMSQMDIAAGMAARVAAQGRVATVAVESMVFHKPVKVGDVLCCYAHLEKRGVTSITHRVQAWVFRQGLPPREKVTEGMFTFVALNEDGSKRPLPPEEIGE